MKKNFLIFLLGLFSVFTAFAQVTVVKGSVKDAALIAEYGRRKCLNIL